MGPMAAVGVENGHHVGNGAVPNGTAHAPESPIRDFYAGRSVFVTGATGFVGKVLVEKLLRSCPDIKTVYILVRVKRGQSPEERVRNLLSTELFRRAKKEVPGCERKVKPVPGDIMQEGLGIPYDVRQELINNVSVIIHVAATIRFTETIKLAAQMNIIAVKYILALAKSLKHCAAVVHTSTAYAHTYRSTCPETFLDPSHDPNGLIQLLECASDEVAEAATPTLIKRHPNTYTFTKNCAEDVIRQGHEDGIPVCVVRPAIVTPTWREPYVGWTDTFAGPPGMMAACGSGMSRVMPGRKDNKLDMVPVDVVANFLLVAAWHTHVRCGKTPAAARFQLPSPVLNCTSGQDNPTTVGQWVDSTNKAWHKFPMKQQLARRPSLEIITLKGGLLSDWWGWRVWMYRYWELASECVPGYLLDIAALAQGRDAFSANVYKKIRRILVDYEFFLNHSWEWQTSNVGRVMAVMSESDRKTFNMCMKTIHWQTYIEKVVLGIKKFKLSEGVDSKTVEDARKHLQTVAFRGFLARIATGLVLLQLAQALGVLRRGRTGTQSIWVAVFIMAWYSRQLRSWVSGL